VLKAATINGATALGVDARLGSIEAGPNDHADWELEIRPLREE
jgi:imidazolonepropionase-like amidohydrolase